MLRMPVASVAQLAVQVKRNVWLMGAPLLVAVITAALVRLNGVVRLPPAFAMLPGSVRLKVPELNAPPVNDPVTADMSAEALPPLSSTRVNAPLMLVLMFKR